MKNNIPKFSCCCNHPDRNRMPETKLNFSGVGTYCRYCRGLQKQVDVCVRPEKIEGLEEALNYLQHFSDLSHTTKKADILLDAVKLDVAIEAARAYLKLTEER